MPALPGHRPARVAPAHSWGPFSGLGQSLFLEAQVIESMFESWPYMTLGKWLHFSEPQFTYL